MRLIALASLALLVLTACTDEAAKTFGRTFDECVLKNARGGQAQAAVALPVCRRHFERTGQPGLVPLVEATKTLSGLSFTITNNNDSRIVTSIAIDVPFHDGNGKALGNYTWTYDVFAEPARQIQLEGSFGNAPSWAEIGYVDATVLREIPTGR